VDARLAAAILALHTSARVAGGPVDPHPARHVQEAVAARSAEILRSMHSTCQVALIEDLRELAAWEERDGSAQHVFVQALRHYEPLIACSEVAAFVHSVSTGERKIAMKETSEADVVVDAGASADDELYRLLRQTGGSAGGLEGGDDVKCMEEPSSGPSMLSVIYRAYKCMILWDAVLAAVS